MEYRFVDKNVDLPKTLEKIEHFFQARNFKTRTETADNTARLVALVRLAKEGTRRVEIIVTQKPNCLSINFVNEKNSFFSPMNPFISYMGAGFLVKRELEASEFYQKLEQEFWDNIEPVVSAFPSK
jgi:hypothetical protein